MSNFKYTSWGRTRRPKNITGMDRAYVTGALSIANLQENTPAGGFTESPNNKSSYLPVGIYETENQRFCHIMTSGSATVTNMYIYNYAAGFWSELLTGSLGGPVVVGGNDSAQHRIVEIAGADLVALNTGSAGKISLSFSTF